MGDTSSRGLRQSCGMMINYLYDLGQLEVNNEAYVSSGRIRASAAILALASGVPPVADRLEDA